MEEQRFDQFTKELAAPVTRRGALKALVVAAVGGVLTQLNGGNALADDCKALGDRCEKDSQCCSAICVGDSANSRVCRCPPRTVPCRGRCVPQCCAPLVLNPDTCNCQCPNGTQPCPNRLTGQITCCPPGKICSPTDGGCVCPPQQCPPGQVQDPTTCKCTCPPNTTTCADSTGAVTCCPSPMVCGPNGVGCVCPPNTTTCANAAGVTACCAAPLICGPNGVGCVCPNTCPSGTTQDPVTCQCSQGPCPDGRPPCGTPVGGVVVCCPADQYCVNGKCSPCPAGQTLCGGATAPGTCTDLQTDPSNCGACGNVCPQGPNSTATCSNGHCSIICAPGFADCDNNPSNGCEVNLNSDAHNCGGCGVTCTGNQTCTNGHCV